MSTHLCWEPTARDREKNQARSPASTKACISRQETKKAYRDAGVVEPTSRDPVEWLKYARKLKKMYRNLGCKGEPKTASDAHKCIRKQLKKARSSKPRSPKPQKTLEELLHACREPTARDREKNQARSTTSTKACISRHKIEQAYRDAGVVEPTSRDPVEWSNYEDTLKKMYRNLGCKGEPKTASDAHKCIRKQLKKASPKPRSPKPQTTLEELLHACREPTARDREKNQARSTTSTKACISRHKIEQAYRDAGVVEPTSRDPVEWSNYEDTLKKMYRNLGCKGEPKTASDAHKCIRKQLKKASPKPRSPKPQKTLEELLHACREPTARDREKNQARSPTSTKACISRHKIEQAYRDAGVVEPTSRDPVEWSNYEDTLKKMYRNLGCKGEPKTASDAHKCIRKQLKKASPKPRSPKPQKTLEELL